jgi:hypothetical protein
MLEWERRDILRAHRALTMNGVVNSIEKNGSRASSGLRSESLRLLQIIERGGQTPLCRKCLRVHRILVDEIIRRLELRASFATYDYSFNQILQLHQTKCLTIGARLNPSIQSLLDGTGADVAHRCGLEILLFSLEAVSKFGAKPSKLIFGTISAKHSKALLPPSKIHS